MNVTLDLSSSIPCFDNYSFNINKLYLKETDLNHEIKDLFFIPAKSLNIHAVFVLIKPYNPLFDYFNYKADIVVVTRPFSKLLSLPGGKTEGSETCIETALRESIEEGIYINKFEPESLKSINYIYEDKLIKWIIFNPKQTEFKKLKDYREKHRNIIPNIRQIKDLQESKFGLPELYEQIKLF